MLLLLLPLGLLRYLSLLLMEWRRVPGEWCRVRGSFERVWEV